MRRLQCDEIWSFVGAKRKNVNPEREADGWGDVWTWTAIDADTKLIMTYYVGDRGKGAAYEFMQDCAERIVGRPQIYIGLVEQGKTSPSVRALFNIATALGVRASLLIRRAEVFNTPQSTRR